MSEEKENELMREIGRLETIRIALEKQLAAKDAEIELARKVINQIDRKISKDSPLRAASDQSFWLDLEAAKQALESEVKNE